RPTAQRAVREAYAQGQGLWHDETPERPTFSAELEADLATVEPSLPGPRRPQDRVALTHARETFRSALQDFAPGAHLECDAQDESVAESFPASDPPANGSPGHQPAAERPLHVRAAGAVATPSARAAAREGTVDGQTLALDP